MGTQRTMRDYTRPKSEDNNSITRPPVRALLPMLSTRASSVHQMPRVRPLHRCLAMTSPSPSIPPTAVP